MSSFSFVVFYLVVGGFTKTLIVPAVLYLKMCCIVRITRISAFQGYMTSSAFCFLSFCV